MTRSFTFAVAMALTATGAPAQDDKREAHELLFRDGTLDNIAADNALVYSRDVSNALSPETAERDTGEIALSIADAEDDTATATLEFRQDGKERVLGQFPASVGNPMIMYFYETVVRDMAETAGGSPFYIRNRIKESLIQPAIVEEGSTTWKGRSVPTTSVRIAPFATDPNKDRMRGFGDLKLEVTMSDEVPGWYLSLQAEARPEQAAESTYRSVLTFEALEQE